MTIEPEEQETYWELAAGFYPGILLGIRTYEEKTFKTHVLYLPFINFTLDIYN